MKTVRVIGLTAFAVTMLAIPERAVPAVSDQAQIQGIYQRFAVAVRHRDVDAVMSFYVRDNSLFVYDVAPPRQYVGWSVAYTHSDQGVRAVLGKMQLHALVRVTDIFRKIG